jgi:hypothetical protein
MNRKLLEIGALTLLVAAWTYAAVGVKRGVPAAWLLFVTPAIVYGVITVSQRVPIASLNLTIKVTPDNTSRVEPVVRDFLASIKVYSMVLVVWVCGFATSSIQLPLFLFGVGAALATIFAMLFGFLGKIKRLA